MVNSYQPITRVIEVAQEHRLFFTDEVFRHDNPLLEEILTPREPGENVRVLVIWDQGVESTHPNFRDTATAWFAARPQLVRLAAEPVVVRGGEIMKNTFRELERLWLAIEEARMCRHSYIVVVGGGAVLDVVGFAASTAHRGIPLVRIPSTSLSQADGGIGVKNGINFFGRKNWLGAFSVPHAVVNDLSLLRRLPTRERRAGLVEAVKVALIRDGKFFEFIAANADKLAAFEQETYEAVIRESAAQHLEHIATSGDPFERGSARPLDFGHWSAHKLEQISAFELSHAEAVAIGMALDVLYAVDLGLMEKATAERILSLLRKIGFSLFAPQIEAKSESGRLAILEGLDEFREHMGGQLSIPMVHKPGQRSELHEMSEERIVRGIAELKRRFG